MSITLKGSQKEKFYVVFTKTHSIPERKNVNGAKFKKVAKLSSFVGDPHFSFA